MVLEGPEEVEKGQGYNLSFPPSTWFQTEKPKPKEERASVRVYFTCCSGARSGGGTCAHSCRAPREANFIERCRAAASPILNSGGLCLKRQDEPYAPRQLRGKESKMQSRAAGGEAPARASGASMSHAPGGSDMEGLPLSGRAAFLWPDLGRAATALGDPASTRLRKAPTTQQGWCPLLPWTLKLGSKKGLLGSKGFLQVT